MVLGGLEVTSYTTLLIPLILFTIWLEMFCKKDFSNLKKSAVMPSSDVIALNKHKYSYVRLSPITPTVFTGSKAA